MTLLEWEAFSWAFVSVAFGTVLRSLVLAALCAVGVWLLRGRTAELRFSLWRWLLLALFALPVLMTVTPTLRKASHSLARVEAVFIPSAPATATVSTGRQPAVNQPVSQSIAWIVALPVTYALVALALLFRLGYNLWRLGRLSDASESIVESGFRAMAHDVWLESGAFVKPRVVVSGAVCTPVTFDLGEVWILLPRTWRAWNEAKLRAALTHEMAHVRRRDSANLLLASAATCLFWFHPLAWFLRRELAALAEEACDETTVSSMLSPEQYAEFLIQFAGEVRAQHGRFLMEATGVARNSKLKARLEKLFVDGGNKQKGRKCLAALALVLFLPSVYLMAAARFEAPQAIDTVQRKPIWPIEEAQLLTEEDAAKLQTTLPANPDDQNLRMELLLYASIKGQEKQYREQLLWFIEHHPAMRELGMAEKMFGRGERLSGDSLEQIEAAWQRAMAMFPDSARVTLNAAWFIETVSAGRGLALLRRAETLYPAEHDLCESEITSIYAAAELQPFQPGRLNNIEISGEEGARLRQELEVLRDPALLAAVGKLLTEMLGPGDHPEQTNRGLGLIKQAIQIDPGNAKWTEALESAQAAPERMAAYARMAHETPQRGMLRLGSGVAESGLSHKVEPIYPPLAKAAGVRGTVEFTVTVGADGKVQRAELVRGHPLLVEAAKTAVMQSEYHPVTIDGKAKPFLTQVIVQMGEK